MAKRGSKKLTVRVENKRTNKPKMEMNIKEDGAEREKKMFMWLGSGCVMAVILIIWFLNLKNEFRDNSAKNNNSQFDWSQVQDELNKAMSQVKQGISEIKKLQSEQAQNTSPASPTDEQIEALKGKLIMEVGTSTATTTSVKK